MPERTMQIEDPAALPAPGRRLGPPPEAQEDLAARIATVAGAVAALARKVEELTAPKTTPASRRAALEDARDFVGELSQPPLRGADRITAELHVARFLAGE